MRTMDDLLAEHPFFAGLDHVEMALLAGCASNVHANADEMIIREGGHADTFYVVRHGRVALELHSPTTGPLVLDTVDDGGILGWEWLVPPHRWVGDARAVEPTSLIAFDGACLRAKCEADPKMGYDLLKRVADVMYHRLLASRLRLLDLYGAPHVRAR
jgi:CRP-like cAMP-binding protein